MSVTDLLRAAELAPVLLCCGQPVEDLWDHLQRHRPVCGHARHCPYCQDALAGMKVLAWATSLMRAEERPTPTSLVLGVLDVVRSIADRGRPPRA